MHADLILAAAAWLKAKRCTVIITDMVSAAGETPDAIGFNSFRSMLIECKASRGDFRRDADKPHRRSDRGMGSERFYLVPEGMLKLEELPEGWGLLEMNMRGRVRLRRCAQSRKSDREGEISLLVSALRRIGNNPPPGISVKCYTMETLGRATIGIELENSLAQG